MTTRGTLKELSEAAEIKRCLDKLEVIKRGIRDCFITKAIGLIQHQLKNGEISVAEARKRQKIIRQRKQNILYILAQDLDSEGEYCNAESLRRMAKLNVSSESMSCLMKPFL